MKVLTRARICKGTASVVMNAVGEIAIGGLLHVMQGVHGIIMFAFALVVAKSVA